MRSTTFCIVLLILSGIGCSDSPDSIGESPTGTFLNPRGGLGEQGYVALDEACGQVDAFDYVTRFKTPMFRDIAFDGNTAFLVDGSLLWVLDTTVSSEVERLSLTRLPGTPLSLAVQSDTTVWIAAGESGLLAINTSDRTTPQLMATLMLEGPALDIAVSENRAYVAMGDKGLAVVDIEQPDQAAVISIIETRGFANAVDIEQQKAYVAACTSFSIVNVEDVSEPRVLGSYWVPEGHARELDAVGEALYIAGGEALFAFDVSDPLNVEWTGFYADPEAEGFYVNAVVVSDGTAYIAAGDESVRAIDVSEMASAYVNAHPVDDELPPSLDGPIALPSDDLRTIQTVYGDPINVGLNGDHLYVLGNYRYVGERLVRIMDISTLGDMRDIGEYVQPDETVGIDAFGDGLVVHYADGEEAFISPDNEERLRFRLPGRVERTIAAGNEFYFLLNTGSVYRWLGRDVQPDAVINSSVYDFSVTGDALFASHVSNNAIVTFINDRVDDESAAPTAYRYSGQSVPDQDNAFLGFSYLFYVNDHLYAYDWAMGALHIFDAGDPTRLERVSVMHVGYCEMYDIADFYSGRKLVRAKLLEADDGFALLCPFDEAGQSSVFVFDVSIPYRPVVSEHIALPEVRYTDLFIRDGAITAVGFDNNIYVSTLVQIDDGLLRKINFDGRANGLALFGGHVFVSDGDFGVRKFLINEQGFEEVVNE